MKIDRHKAHYRYNLVTSENEFASRGCTQIWGYSQSEFKAMGGNMMNKLIHHDDLPMVKAYHQRLKTLDIDESDSIYARTWHKQSDRCWEPIFVCFNDTCVEVDERGLCSKVEGTVTALDLNEYYKRLRLEHAICRNEIGFYYQPIVDLKTKAILGFEALARWFRGDEIVSPDQFLPSLRELGLEQRLITKQIQDIVRALHDLPKDKWISYNLSQAALDNDISTSALSACSIVKSSRMHIEILETVQVRSPETIAHLKLIHACGHDIFLDDFSQGFSNLSCLLSDVPIDGVKLDRVLVEHVITKPQVATVTKKILEICNSLNIKTIAEWVGTEDQCQWLIDHGCQWGQGALFGMPKQLEHYNR
jgi:EAL domain-containing protein (putative c-di-GMP-specific phosphodiesterase class I)